MNRRDVSAKVEELLARMTDEEKIAQMIQIPYSHVGREEALRWARLGAGSFLHVLGDEAREVQRTAIKESRLGIPVLFGIDAIHGHGLNRHATIFPSQLATACAWDPEVARTTGEVTAREVATDGLHWTFSPVLCLGRDPRWGRVDETFGEDSYLSGELSAAIVSGYQGDDLTDGEHILACAKHYIGYGEALGGRDACDTEMTYRKMKEIFLPPFRRAVEAGCATFMTAYGSIDGTPFTADRRSLTDILRGELGFDGFVVTDWDNVTSLITRQRIAKDYRDAAALAIHAGNDMIMATPDSYEAAIAALKEGQLSRADVDAAVRHILTVKFRMNLFGQPEKKGRPGCFGCEEHLEKARNAARRTITLVRNDGLLPFSEGIRSLALIGPNADDIHAQYGDWTYFTHPKPDASTVPERPYVTVKEGLERECALRGVSLTYARGCGVEPDSPADIPAALKAAEGADAIVLVLGDNVNLHGEYKDRANLDLSGQQLPLYRALAATGKPIAVVLVSSKPLCLHEAAGASAVMVAFNGGMFGGQAVAEALFGVFNPSGRLPISFPRTTGQVPVYYSQLTGWHGDKYVDEEATPQFAFGEGLGYTAFAYSDLRFDPASLTASVEVANTGDVPGTETVQVYFRDEVSSVMTPMKRLIRFTRVQLAPGEHKAVTFRFAREDFALVNRAEERVTEPGDFTLMIGHSSRAEDLLSVPFTLC